MKLPVTPPIEPMLARLVEDLPVGWWYEPKWDGFRALVFRDGDGVRIESRNNRPMARYFPEVVAAIKATLPEQCVVDAEIVVASPDDGKLDFFSLQQRLHPAASRVDLLAARTPATLIAFDLLSRFTSIPPPASARRHARSAARSCAAARPPAAAPTP